MAPRLVMLVLVLVCAGLLRSPTAMANGDTSHSAAEVDAVAAVEALKDAGWGGWWGDDDFAIRVRRGRLFGAGILQALQDAERLPDGLVATLQHVAEVRITEPGWFINTAVDPGTWRLGLAQAGPALQVELRGPDGHLAGSDGIWITGADESLARGGMTARPGWHEAQLVVGRIQLAWRYVARQAHDAACGDLRETIAGPVRLLSDLGDPELERALANALAAAVPAQFDLLGRQLPVDDRPLTVLLFSQRRSLQRVVDLIGAAMLEGDALACRLTDRAYVWCPAWFGPGTFATRGGPVALRAVLIHELHHLIAFRLFGHVLAWPGWLLEGLAEAGTERALRAERVGAAQLARWRVEDRFGRTPHAEDLLDGTAQRTAAWYGTAWLLVRHLADRDLSALHSLIERVDSRADWFGAAPLARTLLGADGAGLVREVIAAARAEEAGPDPVLLSGYSEAAGDGIYRLIAGDGGAARLALSGVADGVQTGLSGQCAFDPVGGQLTVVLAWTAGRRAERLVQVAIRHDGVSLLALRNGVWQTWADASFDAPLPGPADDGTRRWLDVRVQLDAGALRVSVDVAGRLMDWPLPEPVAVAGTLRAVGVSDGAGCWRRVG